jgi:Helix-turn-helix domain
VTVRIERPTPRRGLSRVEAATYLGVSPSKFDELRKSGRIGPAKVLDGRKLYAIEVLDEFFDALPDESFDTTEDWTVAL